MSNELDTQPHSEEEQGLTEQAEEQGTSTAQTSNEEQSVQEQSSQPDWEGQFKDLQRDYTRKSQQLAEYQRQVQEQPAPVDDSPSAETFYQDPVGSTAKVVQKVFADYESRQEERRQAEQYLHSFAEDRGIPERNLQQLNARYVAAQNDPEARLEILAAIHAAQNAGTQLQAAQKTIKDDVQRNARAVTAEGGALGVPESAEISMEEFRSWPREKREAYLIKRYGVHDY